jgi:hypothetical protein
VGHLHRRAIGRPGDNALAVQAYEKACTGGEDGACADLAFLLSLRRDAQDSGQRTLALVQGRCDKGIAAACYVLGDFYAEGIFVERDDRRAFAAFASACRAGHVNACEQVARVYEQGELLPQNLEKAAECYMPACEYWFFSSSCLGAERLMPAPVETVVLNVGPAAEPDQGAQLTNHQSQGNLESTKVVMCRDLGTLESSMSPADLYPAVPECVRQRKYELAAQLYALAGTYARFDQLRVADRSAHQAKTVLEMNYLGGLAEQQRARFSAEIEAIASSAHRLTGLCQAIRKVGYPRYFPSYMVQHGMGAFTGQTTPDGLVVGFDPEKAWNEALSSNVHCEPPLTP